MLSLVAVETGAVRLCPAQQVAQPRACCLTVAPYSKRATQLAKDPKLTELGSFDAPISFGLYLPKKF